MGQVETKCLADDRTNVSELVDRLIAVEAKIGDPGSKDVDAVLGAIAKPSYSLSDALQIFVDLNKPELRGKNEGQRRRWRNPLELAVRNFTDIVGSKPLSEIARDDALAFRAWWVDERIGRDIVSANTANKNLMALRESG